MHWFAKFEQVYAMIAAGNLHCRAVPSIRSVIRLASGEAVSSAPFDVNPDGTAG